MEDFKHTGGTGKQGQDQFYRKSNSTTKCNRSGPLDPAMRMRLQAANRDESPTALLAQFKIIQQQTLQTEDGQSLNEITEINPAQKPLFNAPELKAPTPNNLLTSSL